MARLSNATIQNIKQLHKNGCSIEEIMNLSGIKGRDVVERAITGESKTKTKPADAEDESTEEVEDTEEQADEDPWYESWTKEELAGSVEFWKQKYLSAHVELVINDLA